MSLSVSIRHRFRDFALDAAFESAGGVTALFGRSGAGKTTIANAIGGLIRPDAGKIAIDDRVLLDTASGVFVPAHQRRIGYVFQDARLFPHLTVRQNLLFGRFFTARRARYGDFGHVVDLLGIGPLLGRRPGTLSGGERQRVAIGRALLASPRALVMDEPLASLDEPRKAEILPFIERLRDEVRVPIVYVSHSVTEVARLAATMVIVSDGRVEKAGPAAEIMADPTLFPAFGRYQAGALLTARITGHDPHDRLSMLSVNAGKLIVPLIDAPVGTAVQVQVRARDIILATTRPEAISALNILAMSVGQIGPSGSGIVDVQLVSGDDRLLARITRRSLEGLKLEPGAPVFVILKSIAVGRRDIGVETAGSEAI